ncbi:MAG: hypothetical protein AB7V46_04725 [Thermomicrobiales bacterium]
MPDAVRQRGLSQTRNILSLILFALAGVLLVVAIYLFWEDRNQEQTPAAPSSIPGQAQLKTVHDALATNFEVEYGRESARVDGLTPVGQQLLLDGQSAFVFIFPDPDERELEMQDIDATEVELVDSFGDSITSESVSVSEGSNVVVMAVGVDDDVAASVDEAVATIP